MRIFSGALLAATVAELALIASQSSAQYFGVPYYGQPPPYTHETPDHGTRGYYGTRAHHHHGLSKKEVTVTTRSSSREVPLYDLDLRTSSGVHELHDRISDTATTLCSEENKPRDSDCYRDAMHDAMAQAHEAIREAGGHDTDRSYGGY